LDSLKVLLVSPEAVPYAKTGGLADVAGALPKSIASLGHRVGLMMPLYGQVNREKFNIEPVATDLIAHIAGRDEKFNLHKGDSDVEGLSVYFIEHQPFFNRPELYRDPATGQDWADNDERFGFFARAVLEACRKTSFIPDIIHCNDWQSGLIPAFLKEDPEYAEFSETSTLFSIHNIAYQGNFPSESFKKLGLDDSLFTPGKGFEYWGNVSYLKAGVWYSDLINTVSETYAQEIQSSNEYGNGFEGILKDRSKDLFGILNGIDYSIWDPSVDNLIPSNYSPEKLAGKKKCKNALRKSVKLPMVRRDVPIIGIISRLADQKGFDLIEEVADDLMGMDIQIALLGTGDEKYHKLFSELHKKHSKKIAALLEFNNEMAHLIEAGSDMFLMPSRYEPCGLNQLYSLRYGTIPIVRKTGGLADTIENANPAKGTGNGFVFTRYNAREMLNTIKFACEVYRDKNVWEVMMLRGMRQDFSWETSARKYVEVYGKALAKKTSIKT
jgi:starch synthase